MESDWVSGKQEEGEIDGGGGLVVNICPVQVARL